MPRVSVVLPAHDAADWIEDAVRSALGQTLAELELIAVDDGSTDGTGERLDAMRDAAAGRLVVVHQERRGAAAARNAALARARGRYIGFLDADDRWHPQNLERKVGILEADEGADLVFSGYRTIDAEGRPTGWCFRPPAVKLALGDLLLENPIGCGSVVVARREAVEAAGRFDEELRASIDFDLWLRIAARRPGALRYVPEVLADYRRRPGQITGDWRQMDQARTRVFAKMRTLAPETLASVERRARASYDLYLAELAARAGDRAAVRRLVGRAWRSPGEVLRLRRGWRATAQAGFSLLPHGARDSVIQAVRSGRRQRASRSAALRASAPDGPLRVAMLVPEFPELSQTFVLNEIAGLLERGHDVTVFALGFPPKPASPQHPLVRELGLRERTVYLNPGAGPLEQGAEWLRALVGLRPGQLPGLAHWLTRPQGPLGPAALRHALRIARHGSFDVVHCQFGPLGLLAASLREAGLLSGALVTHFRGWDVSRYVAEHGPQVYAPLFADGDLFLSNCDHFRKRLEALGCDPARIAVKRSGIDLERFGFRARTAPAAGEPVEIVSVGRLVAKKGFADALDALARAAGRRPETAFRYRIVGDGPLRRELEARAWRLGLQDRVSFLGGQAQDALVGILDTAHLFVAPSVTSEAGDEDAPVNTLKEAMAMGLPVVATRHGGIPELVEDGGSGLLVPERSPEDLARALETLVDVPERWESMGRAGRARVEAEYDRRVLDDRLERLYRRAVARTSA